MKSFILIVAGGCAIAGAVVLFTIGLKNRDQDDISKPAQSSDSTAAVEYDGLADSKQQFIWDTEHFVFEIESKVGRRLTSALRNRDSAGFADLLGDQFLGMIPGRSGVVETSVGPVRERVIQNVTTRSEQTAVEFADYVSDQLSDFVNISNAGFRVLKIKAVESGSTIEDAQWALHVLLTCSGMTAENEHIEFLQEADVVCQFTTDKDIESGEIFRMWSVSSEKTRRGSSMMEEITASVGLDVLPLPDNWRGGADGISQYSMQIAGGDFDNDGFTDIAIATRKGDAYILKSDSGKRFRDVTQQCRIATQFDTANNAFLATWFDFDNDGYLDLILGESLYRNREGKTFEMVSLQIAPSFGFNPMGCVVADYDCDGLLDLYVLHQSRRNRSNNGPVAWVGDNQSGESNHLWKNRGGGKFEDVTKLAGVSGGHRHSFAATWLHANDDVYPDLYVANDFAENSFFINRKDGTFEDVTKSSGTADFATSMGVAAGDIDGDGTVEIYVANMYSKMGRRIIAQVDDADYPPGTYQQLIGSCAGNRMYQKVPGRDDYEDVSEPLGVNPVGWAYAPVLADFDHNGFLDIYATAGFLSFDRRKPDG